MLHTRLFNCSILLILITSCALPGKVIEPGEAASVTRKQQSENADIFNRKGKYEHNSSFQRRQEAAAKADDFFMKIGRENCVIKVSADHMCYRAINNGYYQIYSNGFLQTHGKWTRLNNTFCVESHCKPVSDYDIQSYSQYSDKFQAPVETAQSRSLAELQDERVELTIRSMTCYKCAHGRWQDSVDHIFKFAPNCTAELNKHNIQYGALNIQGITVAVTDKEENDNFSFLTAAVIPGAQEKYVIGIDIYSAQKSDACNPKFEITKNH